MMDIDAFAPARILQQGDFYRSRNWITGCDPVPWLDPVGVVQGLRNGNVHFLPTTGCPIVDHYYTNRRFADIHENQGFMFQKKYGGVF
jgi:hypothetical protein